MPPGFGSRHPSAVQLIITMADAFAKVMPRYIP